MKINTNDFSQIDSQQIKDILNIQMQNNDAEAATIGDYLAKLLYTLWVDGESFSAKRPFGNSGWDYDLLVPLIKEGILQGSLDEDGYIAHLSNDEEKKGYKLISFLILEVFVMVQK